MELLKAVAIVRHLRMSVVCNASNTAEVLNFMEKMAPRLMDMELDRPWSLSETL
jgi:hypothetical protein